MPNKAESKVHDMAKKIQQTACTGGIEAGNLSLWLDVHTNGEGGEEMAVLAVWAAAARAAAPARLAKLASMCNEAGPMLTRGALDCESPGIDVVLEAVSWGRWEVVRTIAGAGGDIGAVWECPLSGDPVNVLGLALVRFHDLCSVGLMSPDMRADFMRTLEVVTNAAGPVAMVGGVPPALAGGLLTDFAEATGQRLQLVWGC